MLSFEYGKCSSCGTFVYKRLLLPGFRVTVDYYEQIERPCTQIQYFIIFSLISLFANAYEQFRFHALTMTMTYTSPRLARILIPVAYNSSESMICW